MRVERICHEMAKQISPGLQPWVRQDRRSALKVAPEWIVFLQGMANDLVLLVVSYTRSARVTFFGRHS
jgi:hypothetical protein